MEYTTLGKTGLCVSRVGMGGIPIQRVSDEQAVDTLSAGLDWGINFIDTAAGYGDSQKKIGKAIAGKRDRVILATKSGSGTRDGILADIDRARKELGTDYIDIYQLHGVSTTEKWEQCRGASGAVEGLLRAREEGHIGHIGFTSHSLDMSLELVEEDLFETVQFPFNLVTREPMERLIPRCRERGLGFIVMKPLCGGQFDNADLAFKFLNGYPDLVPIPGVENPREIEQIARLVASGATLQGEEQQEAERIAAELGKQFCRRCGYCEPCPNGVPIQTCMVFDGFVRRFARSRLVNGPARKVVDNAPNCIECGECEAKCPYDLPIMTTIDRVHEQARSIVAQDAD